MSTATANWQLLAVVPAFTRALSTPDIRARAAGGVHLERGAEFLVRRRTANKTPRAISYAQPEIRSAAEAAQDRSAWRSQVMEAAKHLPERTRQVVELYFLEELPDQVIARKLGMSVKSVANHKTQGRKLLKELIGKQGLYALLILYLFK